MSKRSRIAAWAVLILFVSGCGRSPSTERVYRIGLGPWIGFGPLYLAQNKGFFQQAGIKVELTVLTGLAERNSALKSGKIDGLAAPVDYFVLSAGNQVPMKIVLAADESNGGDGIVANASVKSIADLRGKRVAYQQGLPSEFFLRSLLLNNGISFSSLKATDMETSQAGAAFIAKQLDAACLWEPWLSKAQSDGGGHLLASTREFPDLIVDTLAFTPQVVDSAPADVQKIVDGLLKAVDYWKSHPDESNQIMAPNFQVDAKQYAAILSGVRFCDLARNRSYFGTQQNPGTIFKVAQRASDIWQNAQRIASPVVSGTLISTSFVANAQE